MDSAGNGSALPSMHEDFDHAVARLAHAVRHPDRWLAFASPPRGDAAFGDSVLDQLGPHALGVALGEFQVVARPSGAIGLPDDQDVRGTLGLELDCELPNDLALRALAYTG